MDLVAQSSLRIESTLAEMRREALDQRRENTDQHAEGRRNMLNFAKGIHRRMDKQDEDRKSLREHVDKVVGEAVSENSEGRSKLHGRIDALIWAWLIATLAACGSLGTVAWWIFTHPTFRFPTM